MMISEKQLVSV